MTLKTSGSREQNKAAILTISQYGGFIHSLRAIIASS